MDKSQTVVSDTRSKDEQKEIQEVEETKSSPASNVEVNHFTLKKLSNPFPPKRCVIFVPPLYLDNDAQNKWVAKNQGKFGYEWNEIDKLDEDSLVVLCKAIKVKDRFLVGATTFFLFAGFDEESKVATLRKLESVAEKNDTSLYRKQETTYIASRDKQKSLDNLWSGIRTFIETLAKELPNNYLELNLSKSEDISDKVDFAREKLRDIQAALSVEQIEAIRTIANKARGVTNETDRKKALFFIPIGMPGMGKTTFINILKNLLEERGCRVTVISSDRIRKQKMDEAMQRDSNLTEDDAFDRVGIESHSEFFENIADALQKTDNLSQDTHVILLDKNHVPSIIHRTNDHIKILRGKSKLKCAVKTVFINPHCNTGFRNQTSTFPFSLTFFLTCLYRAIDRKDHETLTGTNIQAVRVLVRFFKAYKNFANTDDDLRAFKANFVMEIPFTHEGVDADKNLPEALVTSFNVLLDTVEEPDEEKIVSFLNEFEKYKFEPKNLDINMIAEVVLDGLNKNFSLF